jgi:ferric-dicitrate binding protein FerR (iron transport regulator)
MNSFLNLTAIRARLAPAQKLDALAEFRRLERKRRLGDWLWALSGSALAVLLAWAGSKLFLFLEAIWVGK